MSHCMCCNTFADLQTDSSNASNDFQTRFWILNLHSASIQLQSDAMQCNTITSQCNSTDWYYGSWLLLKTFTSEWSWQWLSPLIMTIQTPCKVVKVACTLALEAGHKTSSNKGWQLNYHSQKGIKAFMMKYNNLRLAAQLRWCCTIFLLFKSYLYLLKTLCDIFSTNPASGRTNVSLLAHLLKLFKSL